MTSLQFDQAQGLGYTRGMYRVPLSVQTYDSVTLFAYFLACHPYIFLCFIKNDDSKFMLKRASFMYYLTVL